MSPTVKRVIDIVPDFVSSVRKYIWNDFGAVDWRPVMDFDK